jgi:hypothetical protein
MSSVTERAPIQPQKEEGQPASQPLPILSISENHDTVVSLRRQYLRALKINEIHLEPLANLSWEVCSGRY